MKKSLKTLLMSSALLLAVAAPLAASADTSSDIGNGSGSTDVSATFEKSTQTVNPVNPDNPGTSDNSGDKGNGAAAGGDLSLIYVTNKLDFGSHEIDVSNDQTYAANYTDSDTTKSADVSSLWNNKAVVEVSDVRGTNAGWNLTVSGTALTGTDGTTLKGATLVLPTGTLANTGSSSNGTQSVAVTNALDTAAAQVLTAGKDNGAGITTDQLNPSDIKLTVPANQAKAQGYTTKLTWNLSDTPAS
ncbi:WxL domain-containing protein [Lactiplantibacillus songbeiensis]|uniref:WxL domain-containing protein n=1 Tax=Lactiplantibacillus songbeiensis TaxID=2559920 RepID=A0ABW4C3L0_9LACO|nr:WxL domain-containing protein [Lactiplantibacillus songbeiensis]